MAGTARTRAQLTTDPGAPFRTGNVPTNADFQNLAASHFNLLDDDASRITVDAVSQEFLTAELGVLPLEAGGVRALLAGVVNKIVSLLPFTVRTVDTIAELRALPGDTRRAVYVRGYWAPGDEGGGVFRFDASRVAEDDGGLCIAGWTRKLHGAPITPEMFGATASGDQTAALGKMRDAVESLGGGTIAFYPHRTYSISGVLTFSVGDLSIDGHFARLHSTNTTRTDVLQVFGAADTDRIENVHIKRLEVSGVYWPGATPTGNGIAVKWANRGSIRLCVGRNCSDGAFTITDCDDVQIQNNIAYECGQPINVFNHCARCEVAHNHIFDATLYNGINVEGFANGSTYQPDAIAVCGNTVADAEWMGINMENALRSVVRDNRVSGCVRADGFGIQLYGSPGVECLGNTLTGGAGYGLRIGPNCTEAVIDGNRTEGNALGSVKHDDGPAVATCYSVAIGTTNVFKEGYPVQSGNVSFAGWLGTNNPDSNVRRLDYYGEGTFTPVVYGTTSAGAGTYTVQTGRYTRIGNVVHIAIVVAWTAHSGSGNIEIGGLPFTAGLDMCALSVVDNGHALSAGNVMQAFAKAGTATIVVNQYTPETGAASVVPLDTSVAGIYLSGAYFV